MKGVYMQGRIIKAISGFYYVEYQNKTYECKAKGVFRKNGITPLVGDFVEFEELKNEKGNVISIAERKNELVRPPISNIDLAIIVASVKNPDISLLFIDKQIAFLESINIEPIICINKVDIENSEEIKKIYKNIGYDVIDTCAKNGEGVNLLREKLKDKTCVFIGNSGVGKSSLTNKLLGNCVMQEGDLSKIERGKQTTRHVELIKLEENTYIADSPGFSSFELNNEIDLEKCFVEFPQYVQDCRYRGCNHVLEEECGIKYAVRDGKIEKSRYENYCMLKNSKKI